MTPPAGLRVRPVDDAGSLATYVAIHNGSEPVSPETVASLAWARETYPATHLLLAELDGRGVGVATTGRVYVHAPDHPRYWLGLGVLPEERGRGIGSALLAAASAIARGAGKRGFDTMALETQRDGLRFLERRGFRETGRMRSLVLDLRRADVEVGSEAAAGPEPERIELVTLAQRPELLPGLHEVACDAYPDIPTDGVPIDAGTLDEFTAHLRRPDALPAATVVALERASGLVVGYASIERVAGSTTDGVHGMTAVRPSWRGRGIALAMKREAIRRAARLGIERLETTNDVRNRPMREVNARLGFVPAPDLIDFTGPLLA